MNFAPACFWRGLNFAVCNSVGTSPEVPGATSKELRTGRRRAARRRLGLAGISEGIEETCSDDDAPHLSTRFRAGDGGAGAAPLWLDARSYAADAPSPRKKILVAIFQRGAADGLNVVVPHGEKAYYALRPTIAIPSHRRRGGRRGARSGRLLRLHPSLAPLKPLFDEQHLAIVDAVGSPDPTRSHFDAQDYMESGTPGRKATRDGWMNRALPKPREKPSPVRAVALGPVLPRSMAGDQSARSRCKASPGSRCGTREAAQMFEDDVHASKDADAALAGRQGHVRSRGDAAIDPEAAVHARGRREYPARAFRREPAADRAADQSRRRAWRWHSPISADGTTT